MTNTTKFGALKPHTLGLKRTGGLPPPLRPNDRTSPRIPFVGADQRDELDRNQTTTDDDTAFDDAGYDNSAYDDAGYDNSAYDDAGYDSTSYEIEGRDGPSEFRYLVPLLVLLATLLFLGLFAAIFFAVALDGLDSNIRPRFEWNQWKPGTMPERLR